MKKEKVITFSMIIGAIITLFLLFNSLGFFSKSLNSNKFIEISIEDAISAIENKKEMIIYCGQETCSACRTFSPMLAKVANETNKEIFWLDVDMIENQKILEKYHIQETPALINISKENIWIYRGTMAEKDIKKAILETKIKKLPLDSIVSIELDELNKLEKEPVDFILYIGREDCEDCQMFKPILEQDIKDLSIGVYYINIKEYRQNSIKKNAEKKDVLLYNDLKEKYNIDWVPKLIHIRNGIQISEFKFGKETSESLKADENKLNNEKENLMKWLDREANY